MLRGDSCGGFPVRVAAISNPFICALDDAYGHARLSLSVSRFNCVRIELFMLTTPLKFVPVSTDAPHLINVSVFVEIESYFL